MRWTRRPFAPDAKKGGTIAVSVLLALAAWRSAASARRAVQHPVGLDAADLVTIGDYLLVAKWPYGYSRYSFPSPSRRSAAESSSICPARQCRGCFRPPGADTEFVKRVIALPATRSGSRRDAGPQRQALAPQSLPRSHMPSAPTARARWYRRRRRWSPSSARAGLFASTRLSRRRCRAVRATPCFDQVIIRAPTISRQSRSGRPCLHDGRQPRRQPRQPFHLRPEGGIGFVPVETSSAGRWSHSVRRRHRVLRPSRGPGLPRCAADRRATRTPGDPQ